MRYKDSIADKLQKLREDRLDRRIFHDHLICDARKIRDLKGDRALRIDKGAEPVHDLAVHHFDCPDLNDPVSDGTESCRLNIENNICIIQRLLSGIDGDIRQIIHHISLHTVDHLEGIVRRKRLDIVIRVRERLRDTVVCDRDGRMPPVMSPFYDILHL